MNKILSKKDAEKFMAEFKVISSFDSVGEKHYFVMEDANRGGQWTIMFYENQKRWTLHGKGSGYCDQDELSMTEQDLITFLYKNRKYVNRSLKEQMVHV